MIEIETYKNAVIEQLTVSILIYLVGVTMSCCAVNKINIHGDELTYCDFIRADSLTSPLHDRICVVIPPTHLSSVISMITVTSVNVWASMNVFLIVLTALIPEVGERCGVPSPVPARAHHAVMCCCDEMSTES